MFFALSVDNTALPLSWGRGFLVASKLKEHPRRLGLCGDADNK